MNAWQTTLTYDFSNGKVRKDEQTATVLDERTLTRQIESNVVGVYPAYPLQIMEGFGCAMTETACYLLSRMDASTRRSALETWFGPKGIGARFIRIPIDSCDYALTEYQAVEDPIADPELKTFSLKRDRQYILPMVKEALELAEGRLSVLLSPWSPPAAWKTPPEISQNDQAVYGGQGAQVDFSVPGRCFGGRLRREFYGPWAKYLVKYVQGYLDEGIPVTMLSVQNEASAATNWDSCLWSAEEEGTFLKEYLYPAMEKAGLADKVGLYIWDHNKERMIEHVDEMMEQGILDLVEGFAYHWYSGDHFQALSLLHGRYPDKVLLHSESCPLHMPGQAVSFPVTEEGLERIPKEHRERIRAAMKKSPLQIDYEDAVDYAHDIIGDLNHGMQRFIDWNLCVDEEGGPRHVPGGFAAPIIAQKDGGYTCTVSYAYLRLIAETILPDSQILGTSTCSDRIEAVAVRRPDGRTGVVLLNKTEEPQEIHLRMDGKLCTVPLPERSLSSVLL